VDIKTLDGLLRAGVTHGVSDMHFRPGAPPLFRLNGTMTPVKFDRLLPSHTAAIAGHFLAALGDTVDLKGIQEYDTSYSIPGVARFRINIYRQRGSLAIVARVIPTEIPTVESLGLPAVLNAIGKEERGLVLVTGATGSAAGTVQLPVRLTAEQAAWVLNCQAHDIPILVSSRLLKPLGNPPPNGIKYFATAELLELAKDRVWLLLEMVFPPTDIAATRWATERGDAKARHVFFERSDIGLCYLLPVCALGIGPVDDLVIYVRVVSHIRDIETEAPEIAVDNVKDNDAPRVTHVGMVIDRDTAHVTFHLPRSGRDKLFFLARKCVVNGDTHRAFF